MIEYEEPLSPAGLYRCEEILSIAQRAARIRRRKRRFVRGAGAAMCVATALLAIHRMTSESQPSPRVVAEIPHPAAPTAIVIGRIATDPTITDRLSVLPRASQWQEVGDDELLQSLAAAGQPAGLIQMHGQTVLVMSQETQD
jgi:hypothetical protein